MRSPAFRFYVLSTAVMVVEVLIFFVVLQRPFQPVEGATLITGGWRCVEATPVTPAGACAQRDAFAHVALPTLARDRRARAPLKMATVLEWGQARPTAGAVAIYLPKLSETVEVRLNGALLTTEVDPSGRLERAWNKPRFLVVPGGDVRARNEIEITVFGFPQDGASLHPFYVGDAAVLEPMFDRRRAVTRTAAQIGMAFMGLSIGLFGSLWLMGMRRGTYGWLTLASICAGVFNYHYAFSSIPLSFWSWTIIWNVAIHFLVFSLFMFIRRYVDRPIGAFDRHYWKFFLAGVVALLLAPKDYVFEASAIFSTFSVTVGTGGLVSLLLGRRSLKTVAFFTLYILFSIALAIAGHDWIFMFVRPSPVHLHIGQFALPMIMTISIWLIMTDLMRTANENAVLNRELQTTVDVTTARLEKSFEQLAEVRKKQILETERQRIMFDLHDGVGGQLVNTLAYMQTDSRADPTVRASIEGMLRDLGLMIDSLEAHDNLTTSLGMLRSRLEPLLARTGVAFNWRVMEEPQTPGTGPTLSLNVLRIAQEAITNAVKHADATEISVETDARSITISDNGAGYDGHADAQRHGESSGLGILGMRKRAADIGAELTIRGDQTGTTVSIIWPEALAPA